MSSNHKRDYERYLGRSERNGRAIREDPEYFKPKKGGALLSKATRERIRIFKRDINMDPLRRGQRVKNLDQLINRLLDEHKNGATMDAHILIALHTEGEKAGQRQNQKVEGVS